MSTLLIHIVCIVYLLKFPYLGIFNEPHDVWLKCVDNGWQLENAILKYYLTDNVHWKVIKKNVCLICLLLSTRQIFNIFYGKPAFSVLLIALQFKNNQELRCESHYITKYKVA